MSFKEQIMFEDKYMSIFLRQMVCYPPNVFSNTCSFENWGIFNNYSLKWMWLALAPLATDTEANIVVLVHTIVKQ